MAEVQKWGFGAAPFKPDTLNKNRTVLRYLLSYIDTVLQIAKNKVFNNFRFCSVIQISYFCTTNNIKRYEHSISHP
mgnify:CR=1 FL=1